MIRRLLLFCIPFALVFGSAADKPGAPALHVRYEGGTLPLDLGRTHVTISENKVVFTQGHRTLAIPLQNITAISCNADVRRRFGASVLGVVPRLHLDTAETYYVGLTWTGTSHEGRAPVRTEGIFRLNSTEYNDFLATLERLTGKSAVDTRRVPTVVDFGL